MSAAKRIQVWEGCAPVIVSAVEVFCDRWAPYSTKSRSRSIFNLFDEVIEPAWHTYVETLPNRHRGRELCLDIKLGQLARAVGFGTLEKVIAATHREYCKDVEDAHRKIEPGLEAWFEYIPQNHFDSDPEFEATLETILIVAWECQHKQPKKLSTGRSNRLYAEFCEFCGASTELAAQRKGKIRLGYDPDGAARLSGKYCWGHRPKFLDGTRNPEYLWAIRHRAEFDIELKRLRRQSVSMHAPLAVTGDIYLDLFYLNMLAPRAIYPDEMSVLRNEARQLIDLRVDDRKKRMIIMRASGFTLAAIADEIGANSRQAVSKALASVLSKYRFDLTVRAERNQGLA